MWVVIAKKGTNIHRNDAISDLLDLEKDIDDSQEFYVTKNGSNHRYNVVQSLFYAKIYKSKGFCEKLIKKFNFYKSGEFYRNPFHWLKEYHLTLRKVTQEEWGKMCDEELRKLENSYIHHKNLIEVKRKAFK